MFGFWLSQKIVLLRSGVFEGDWIYMQCDKAVCGSLKSCKRDCRVVDEVQSIIQSRFPETEIRLRTRVVGYRLMYELLEKRIRREPDDGKQPLLVLLAIPRTGSG